MRKRSIFIVIGSLGLLSMVCLAGAAATQIPQVNERLVWRLESLAAAARRRINPPQQVVFVPVEVSTPDATVESAPPPAVTTIVQLTDTPNPAPPQETATLPPTPTPSATPLPERVVLEGVVHEYQQFNNCGPANLAMTLSFWGWRGDQRDTRSFLRPNLKVDDKNVNPSEMVEFVERFAGMRAFVRYGGDLDLLRRLVAAGFPVLIEAGHHPPDDWWMGHYLVVSGYDDQQQKLIVQDSLVSPDLSMGYADLAEGWWRDFNYVLIVIAPPERSAEALELLGPFADPQQSFQIAALRASQEIPELTGRAQFFAWFNLGSSRVGLGDYSGAAEAYDQAFAVYPTLPEAMRPYRLMWYVAGPYEAYYHTGRYEDVVQLANTTFAWVGQPVLEESYYWRGMANLALGKQNLAVADFRKAVGLNPNYAPPRDELLRLGEALP